MGDQLSTAYKNHEAEKILAKRDSTRKKVVEILEKNLEEVTLITSLPDEFKEEREFYLLRGYDVRSGGQIISMSRFGEKGNELDNLFYLTISRKNSGNTD